jgi:mannose-6-phosphate isomerase-like protein (cupin superfamily)
LKKGQDLEIYEMDYTTNSQLQEICDLKQPILFEFSSIEPLLFETVNSRTIDKMTNGDVICKDINDYYKETPEKRVDYIMLPFHSSIILMKTDPASHYFIENNDEFVVDSNYYKAFHKMDVYFKPTFNVKTKNDLCIGSKNAFTPLRYHTHYRQFYAITSGKIKVKMTPYKNIKYLEPIKDYENFEFRSQINVWNPQKRFTANYQRINFLEFDVKAGNVLYIPPYWWYSIQYTTDDTILCGFSYNTVVNTIINLPEYFYCFLEQQQNTNKTVKTWENPENLESLEKQNTQEPEKTLEKTTENIEIKTI